MSAADETELVHTAALWLWTSPTAPASWHFLTIDGPTAQAIAAHEAMRRLELGRRHGFGSVKVRARIGDSVWNTSVFPSKAHDGYLLPVKAAVRKAEGLVAGDLVDVQISLA